MICAYKILVEVEVESRFLRKTDIFHAYKLAFARIINDDGD